MNPMTGVAWKCCVYSINCLRDMAWKWIPVKHPAASQHRPFVLTSSRSDHNNRGHSSSASVCQPEEWGEAGREVSIQSVSTCYKRPLKPLPHRGGEAAAWPPTAECFRFSQIKTQQLKTLKCRPPSDHTHPPLHPPWTPSSLSHPRLVPLL